MTDASVKYKANWPRWFKHWQASELLSIIPPDAELSPTSKVSPDMRGKVPGQKGPDGWNGQGGSWAKDFQMTEPRAKKAYKDGAGIGMQGRVFPGLDIDVTDERTAAAIQKIAFEILGPTTSRGRANSARRVLVYQIADGEVPFKKRRVEWKDGESKQAVELLGFGQYYNVEGLHPSGVPYVWDKHPCDVGSGAIPRITAKQLDAFDAARDDYLDLMGYTPVTSRSAGNGTPGARKPIGAPELMASSPDEVFTIFAAIPCDDKTFESRDEFVQTLSAIKAALGGGHYDEVLDWTLNYPGAEPDYIEKIWQSIRDAELGYSWLEAWARSKGYSTAERDFDDVADANKAIPRTPRDRMIERYVWVKNLGQSVLSG